MSTTIHVGNLSFNLGEKDLLDYFSKYGKVTDTYIVRRGGRPRGYGFVEFSATKEADNALAANGDEINGRVINIELAKGKIVKSNFQNDGPRNNYNNNNDNGYGYNNNYGGNRYNNNRPPRNYNNYNNYNDFNDDGDSRPPRAYNRGGRNFYTLRPSGYNNGPRRFNNNGYNNGPRRYNNNGYNNGYNNGPRRNYRKPETEKEKSLSTIYVSNLPFSYDEKELANLFGEFKVKTAHVVQTRNGRSRGFGFVEFETEQDQLNAVKAKDQTTVKGSDGADRTISVKVSLVEKQSSEETTTTTSTTTTATTTTTD